MIEWIIFGGLALIVSEILFLIVGDSDSDDWIFSKIICLLIGILISFTFFGIPYLFAYGCNHEWFVSQITECINYGPQVFFWFYGMIIVIFLFFLGNKKLLIWKEKIQKRKKK